MKSLVSSLCAILGTVLAMAVLVAGCGQPSGRPASSEVASGAHGDHDHAPDAGHDHAEDEGHDHGGWWCVEHGIPEEECSMCSAKAADRFKEKGDWCEEHQRAESQCFLCEPARAEKYAKLYEAKFGHTPPTPLE